MVVLGQLPLLHLSEEHPQVAKGRDWAPPLALHGTVALELAYRYSVNHSSMGSCIHSRRYGYEALLDNEFHGAADFHFTPYAQKVRIHSASLLKSRPSAGCM